jgi:SnoaL-like domain
MTDEMILAALTRHRAYFNDQKRDEWLDNFVPDPYLEEPVASGIRRGREQYARTIDALIGAGIKVVIDEPELVIVNGNRAAMHFKTSMNIDGAEKVSHVIEEFEVAPDGRIAGIRAFVDPTTLAVLAEDRQ